MPLVGDVIASPAGWVSGNNTSGNNVITGENRLARDFAAAQPTTGLNGNFSFPFTPGPDPLLFSDAVNVNLFYWMNRAHDLHYQAGFNEAAGNYQQDNFGRGGMGGDPILAYSHFGAALPGSPLLVNSFFSSQGTDDGEPAEVGMFASFSGAGGFFTDGALDAEIIIHEYTHGVSNRLVRQGYTTFQGRSMGEAWSDFYSLEYTLPSGAPPDGIYPAGQYFLQAWGTGGRSRPFSTNLSVNPLTYADLGNVISSPEVHADGEIWVEALMEIRANLIAQFGDTEGRRRVRMLVMDGMKLSVPAPSMVDMRDAILLADRLDFDGTSQTQLWAGFAKRGLGVLAYSSGADTAHVAASFDMPSATGRLKFYDDSIVNGEPARILLADSNYTQPTVRVQIASVAGDREELVLARTGSIYVGIIPTTTGPVIRNNGQVSLSTFDFLTAFYVDFSNESGAVQLLIASISTQVPYALASTSAVVSGTELRLTGSSNVRISENLPFAFPFYSKKYRTVQVYSNGLLAFDVPVSSACMDSSALAHYVGIAPLWTTLTFGTAQANEGLFMTVAAPGRAVFRWAAETLTGAPVNFSVALNDDGSIDVSYGAGNGNLALVPTAAGCGSGPTIGISNGHDLFSQTVRLSTTTGFSFRWEPPFNYSSVPEVKLESPVAASAVQGVLTVRGVAYDSGSAIARVDVFIDDVERAVLGSTLSRPDFCAQQNVHGCPQIGFQSNLDVAGLGLTPGIHTLRVRATNLRAGFTDADPVSFTLSADPGRLPIGAIDFPAAGAELSGNVVFSGSAYFDDAAMTIRRVDVLIDGLTYPGTTYGVTRNDVCLSQAAPRPVNCPAVGWSLSLNTRTGLPPLPDGAHSIQIRVQDDSGRLTTIPDVAVPFSVKNGPQQVPIGAVTSPLPNAVLTGVVTLSGYAYSPGGVVTSAALLVDNTLQSIASYGLPQPDVCASLKAIAACPNIGFTVRLDTTAFSNGQHVLGFRITNNQGLSITVPALDSGGMNVVIANP